MFADDTNITLSAKTVADLKLAVTSELNSLTCWLRANRLSLNVAKTELMIIGSRQRLQSQCDEIDICQVSHDHRSYERNLSNCVEKPEKVRTSTGFEPVTSRYRCDALTN